MAHITSVTRVPLAGGKTRETGRMVHALKAKCDSSLHEALQKLRTLMEEQGRSKVALALPEHTDLVRARKIIEFAFRNSPVLVALHTQPQGTKQQAGSSAGGRKRPGETLREPRKNNTRRTKDEAILVKAEGLSYADLLKTVKKGVDPEKIGVEILNMRKTRDGHLLLEVSKGVEDLRRLKEEITAKVREVVAESTKPRGTLLHVKEIDGSVSEEEIREAIRDSAAEGTTPEILVKSVRPSYGENQNATVAVPPDLAERLLKKGRIKIGWTYCRVVERVEISRCYKCWRYGHFARECTEPSREESCLKCGKTGHKAKGCVESPYCPVCRSEEHSAGGRRCRVFRKAWTEATTKSKASRR